MTGRSALLARYGTEEPVPEPRLLTAGRLSAELADGNLCAIRWGGHEVLRAVAYVVRDKDWGTYAPAIAELTVAETADGFTVTYQARCEGPGGESLRYDASIAGRADGVLIFDVTAVPETDFLTNRSGFAILHPITGLAGSPVEVEHVDGSIEHSVLPDLIDPYQPFKDMRAITHRVAPGIRATCRMEGDSFEMEDQRNWSDASYKTYVRPLALPWPYVLPAGVPQRQTVTLRIEASPKAGLASSAEDEAIAIRFGEPAGTLPRLGLVLAPEETPATLAAVDALRRIAPQTLLCHFDPTAGHGREALAGFAEIARHCPAETVLECVVPCQDDLDHELSAIAALVREAELRLDALAVSPSVDLQSTPPGSAWPDCPPLEDVYAAARRAFPGRRLGGGMFSYFTELNRKRPPADLLDFVTHCTCPIVHAADDCSVMQSLEALPFITRSARAIIGPDKPYRIGPSTIGMRQNPYGSRTMPNPGRRRIPMAAEDPRQSGLFAAAWMIGYAARVAEAGLEALTVGAPTGPFGLIRGDGTVVPAFHAARMLAEIAGWRHVACHMKDDQQVAALATRSPAGTTLLLANLTGRPLRVRAPDGAWQIMVLDETTPEAWRPDAPPDHTVPADGVVLLRPYAIARLEGR
ncbi:hypothetical protein KXS07_00910 [Inquilinus limosus]|uniref:D-apionate lactonase n=1 Tax=Inquilinus limosus TaxID=171674 RepID=UPI003F172A2F